MRAKTFTKTLVQIAVGWLAIGAFIGFAMPASAQLVEVKQKVLGMD